MQTFFGHTVTCATSGLGETVTHSVAPYSNADDHLFDKTLEATRLLYVRIVCND